MTDDNTNPSEEPVNLPLNDFSQFKNDFKIIRYNKGKEYEQLIINIIAQIKEHRKGKIRAPFEDSIIEQLTQVLQYLQSQNRILDKEIDDK